MKKNGLGMQGLEGVVLAGLVVLLALPVILARIVDPSAGMMVSIFLLLIADPCFFAYLGLYGANNGTDAGVKSVVISAVLFAVGALVGLQMSMDFVVKYAGAYTVLALSAMGTIRIAKGKKGRR